MIVHEAHFIAVAEERPLNIGIQGIPRPKPFAGQFRTSTGTWMFTSSNVGILSIVRRENYSIANVFPLAKQVNCNAR